MNNYIQRLETDFEPLQSSPIAVAVEAQTGDNIRHEAAGILEVLEVLLVRKDHIIARALGVKEARKIELPKTWRPEGHSVSESNKYELYRKKGSIVVPAEEKVKRAGPKRPEGKTKISHCREIYAEHKALPKEDVIKMFVELANCTPVGANTYYITCSKG
jgi:hypothetical protein